MMNLPNKLTLLRVCLIPVFLALYPYDIIGDPASRYAALAVFIIAALTDALDGHIARNRNLITNFGKLMDPMADKLLVAAALIAMVQAAVLPAWAVIIIISREFLITGFRMLALERGVVIAASSWGKLKTVSQMIMIILILLGFVPDVILFPVIGVTVILTVVSAVDYILKNKHVMTEEVKAKK
jgi:CDP-diacylglycerol--glycerol-3-phosphate 3-phosphatidyltransferase